MLVRFSAIKLCAPRSRALPRRPTANRSRAKAAHAATHSNRLGQAACHSIMPARQNPKVFCTGHHDQSNAHDEVVHVLGEARIRRHGLSARNALPRSPGARTLRRAERRFVGAHRIATRQCQWLPTPQERHQMSLASCTCGCRKTRGVEFYPPSAATSCLRPRSRFFGRARQIAQDRPIAQVFVCRANLARNRQGPRLSDPQPPTEKDLPENFPDFPSASPKFGSLWS